MNLEKETLDSKARILVVDDHPLLREGVAQFINRQGDMVTCGEAECISTARAAAERDRPDLLLLDLHLGAGDTVELIKSLKVEYPGLLILVLSQFDEVIFAERALRAGANGYIMKQEATEEVLTAIRAVLAGDMYVSRKLAIEAFRKGLEEPGAPGAPERTERSSERPSEPQDKLSDRELHVFQLVGTGFTTRQIAHQLKLSVKTIEAHRENIKRKLGLSDAAELHASAKRWVEAHLLPQSDSVSVLWRRKSAGRRC